MPDGALNSEWLVLHYFVFIFIEHLLNMQIQQLVLYGLMHNGYLEGRPLLERRYQRAT